MSTLRQVRITEDTEPIQLDPENANEALTRHLGWQIQGAPIPVAGRPGTFLVGLPTPIEQQVQEWADEHDGKLVGYFAPSWTMTWGAADLKVTLVLDD